MASKPCGYLVGAVLLLCPIIALGEDLPGAGQPEEDAQKEWKKPKTGRAAEENGLGGHGISFSFVAW